VIITTAGDFITAAQLRQHLKKDSPAEDAELTPFVSTACQMVVDRIGQVSPVDAVSVVPAGGRVVLEHRPVISVTSVELLPGGDVVPAADPDAEIDGWELVNVEGVLDLPGRQGTGKARVLYVAGRDPIGAKIQLGGLELAAHLWRSSRHNNGGGRPSVRPDEQVVPGVTYALPYNVRQLLGLDKRPQDEVLVG
jgi:hypothetical protein